MPSSMQRSHSISPALPSCTLAFTSSEANSGIERRGRGVDQEGFVEALVLDEALLALDVLVALVDLRGLGESRALLVHRLRREQARHVGRELLDAHGTVVGEQRMKRVVADPGLVPQHVVTEVAYLLHDLAHVVDRAVVGGELDAGHAERALGIGALLVLHARMIADAFAQRLLVPRVPVDRADHAEGIARGGQEHRDGACLHQRALVQRLVVVAVEQHQVVTVQRGAGDDLVGCGSAVQHEVGAVGTEDARGIALRFAPRHRRGSAGRPARRRHCTDRCGRSARRRYL